MNHHPSTIGDKMFAIIATSLFALVILAVIGYEILDWYDGTHPFQKQK